MTGISSTANRCNGQPQPFRANVWTEKNARARAEMIFKHKQAQAEDAPVALSDYKDAQQKQIENMLRLRKLRRSQRA